MPGLWEEVPCETRHRRNARRTAAARTGSRRLRGRRARHWRGGSGRPDRPARSRPETARPRPAQRRTGGPRGRPKPSSVRRCRARDRILCLGVNYAEHAARGRPAADDVARGVRPRRRLRARAPYGELVKPALSERFDYEGELARRDRARRALHPRRGRDRGDRRLRRAQDGTAREWQRAASQWTAGKNFDGTMPIGPELVTADEVDVSDVRS